MWNQVGQSLQQSMERVFEQIAMLLPGVFAFIVAVLIFVALGWGAAWLTQQVLSWVRFDERMTRSANRIAEWTPTYTPTRLVTRVVFWLFVLIGLLVGVSAFAAGSSEPPVSDAIFDYVPRILGAALLLVVGNILARFVSRSVLITAVNMNLDYARLLSIGVKWLVLVLTWAMVLDHLNLGRGIVDMAFGILFGGIVLALSLAVGLGSRDLVSRSLERETSKPVEMPQSEQLRHF
ncbi:MAG: mechanosensitive ion channel family protein [Acidobacteriaceae bacterium]